MSAAKMCAAARAGAALAIVFLLTPTAAAETLEEIERPTRVPAFESFQSLGNGIEPGFSGVYGFTLRNRLNASIENVTLRIEIYRWATSEEAKDIAALAEVPAFRSSGTLARAITLPSLAANGTHVVREEVVTSTQTPEGVYFTRHEVSFDYANYTPDVFTPPEVGHFVMRSRGYFTAAQFESINYSDLEGSLEALNVSGIVPDSSFSVKRPVPLWPIGLLVAGAAVTGGLAMASYLADTNPEKYPRLKQGLLRGSGWLRVRWELGLIALRLRLVRRRH